MKSTSRLPVATFKVDNRLIQHAPNLFASKFRPGQGVQMHLPGMEPFAPFDYWATVALYSLLDPADPTAPVITTPTELAGVLAFAKQAAVIDGYATQTYPSDVFETIHSALHRLYSVEVDLTGYWFIRTGGRGRPRKKPVMYKGRILSSYMYVLPEGTDLPPREFAPDRWENVNRIKVLPDGQPAPPIWRPKDGPRPEGIRYTLAPDLVRGLTGKGENIGATILPTEVFALRTTAIGRSPNVTRLLFWVCRQVDRDMKRDLDGLIDQLRVQSKSRKQNRESLLRGFKLLKEYGVIEDYSVTDPDADRAFVTFTKADGWYFGRDRTEETLPPGA